MSIPEIFGYAAMYSLGAVNIIFLGCLLIGYLTRNLGLAAIGFMVWWVFGAGGLALVSGLVLLGRMLA